VAGCNKLVWLSQSDTVTYFHMFVIRAEAYPGGASALWAGSHYYTQIRMEVSDIKNALAYYKTAQIAAVKSV